VIERPKCIEPGPESLRSSVDPRTERRSRDAFRALNDSSPVDCSRSTPPIYSESADNPYLLPVSIDVKVNGLDGEVRLEPGKPYVYSWRATNASFCEIKEPSRSGITSVGRSMVFPGESYWYPKPGAKLSIRFECGNERFLACDSVVVQ
jgi:hypothetical protein